MLVTGVTDGELAAGKGVRLEKTTAAPGSVLEDICRSEKIKDSPWNA